MNLDYEQISELLDVLGRIAIAHEHTNALLTEIAARLARSPRVTEFDPAFLERTIEELGLSVRAENGLKNERIALVRELVLRTPRELRRGKNIGTLTIREYETALAKLNLRLGMTESELDGWKAKR